MSAWFDGLGRPVLLTTDAFIVLLLAAVAAYAGWARRHEPLRAPWREVGRSPLGMAAAVTLAWFIAIGLLDSIHYRPRLPDAGNAGAVYSPEVLSVLDLLAAHLRERTEVTYSAPFATHLFQKEAVQRADGTQARDYPRLQWGGRHLGEGAEGAAADIARTAAAWTVVAALTSAALTLALLGAVARRRRQAFGPTLAAFARGRAAVPGRTIAATATVLAVVTIVGARLSLDWHVLGTDKVGQDVLYLSLKSVRTGLVIGTLTTLVMLPFALALGVMAGYFGRWIDDVIQYLYTVLSSIPGVLLIAASVLMLQVYMNARADDFTSVVQRADLRLLFLCAILGITGWTDLCRLLRAETLKLREIDYIQAAHAFGVGHLRVMVRHVAPNVMHLVLITVVIQFSGLVLAEAVLSYINIGVDPTMASWGNMINNARLELAREPVVWWSLAAAFAFMFTLVLAANLFADAVRDAFDPRLRARPG